MSKNGDVSGSRSDLLEVFADTVLRWPGRIAIEHHGNTLTYRQLALSVDQLADRLGPRPSPVAVPATHTPDTVVALLGILAAGGVYCPIDPAFPVERQRAMVAAAGCRTLVGRDADALAGQLGIQHVELAAAGDPGTDRRVTAQPDDPAYLLFTSGSTGRPKPVLTPRGAISASTASLRALFGITLEDRVLQFASLNWDTCFEEILPTLTAGARLVFDAEAHSASFPRLLRMVEQRGVTVLDLPTAFWHELVLHLAEDGPGAGLPSCVRLVVIGGEAANPARLADWSRLDTAGIRLLNTYGCTETTLITHAVDLLGPDSARPGAPWDPAARAPIGRALPHVEEVVGPDGELLIGGPALALGYLGLPEATAERFTTTADGRRYFRTGDRVGAGPDGVLTHQGRLDHEVKIRGIRVDPAEVEAGLGAHPEVGAAAVTATTLAGRAALVAYVVPRTGGPDPALAAELLAFLRERVPGHLVPSRITVVPDLVRTASGKVDRAASHRLHGAVPVH